MTYPGTQRRTATAIETSLIWRVEELERELREARSQIEYLHSKFRETGSGNQVLAHIDAVLAKETT